jgi:hypothetical protein
MTYWVRPAAIAICGKPTALLLALMSFFVWCAAAEIYWVSLQVPHHGESAAVVIVGLDVLYSWLLVYLLLALLRGLEELRIPQLRQLWAAALIFILALVFVAPCVLVWLLGGAAWDVLFMAMGSVAGTAGALLWRSGSRARHAPGTRLNARSVTASVPAQSPTPWRAVRVALGAPYAPAPWKRRLLELALVCAVLAGAPLVLLLFESSLSPRGFPILLHVAEFMSFAIAIGLCWLWPLVRVVTLVTSQSGSMTELALLPGQGSGRQQLRRLCGVALSLPAGVLVALLVLALGLVALEHPPHAVYVKVGMEFLLIPLLTLPALAGRLTKPRGVNAWGGAMVLFSQTWTWVLIFWTATPENWHALPPIFFWAAIAVITVGSMFLVGMTIHALRRLLRRPHPYMEVSA